MDALYLEFTFNTKQKDAFVGVCLQAEGSIYES